MTAQLNTLLRLRQYEVDRCRSQLAAQQNAERVLSERLAVLEQQREHARRDLALLTRQGQLNIEALRLRQRHLDLLAADAAALQTELSALQEATARQRDLLVQADQRQQVVERLRERLLREAQQLVDRQSDLDLESAWRARSGNSAPATW